MDLNINKRIVPATARNGRIYTGGAIITNNNIGVAGGSNGVTIDGYGFVKASGTTLIFDNTTYQQLSTAINTSNIGSQSVNYAANAGTLNGLNSNAFSLSGHSHSQYSLTGHTHTGVYQPVGSYVLTSDTRLTDARTPLAHTHPDYSLTGHTHSIYSLSGHSHSNYLDNAGGTITGNLTVNGVLSVAGGSFVTSAQTVTTTDNIILLNNGEVGAGVTKGSAGIQIDRGSANDYQFIFDESTDTFRIGESGTTQAVATREDSPINGNIAVWNSATNKFVTSLNPNSYALSGHTHTGVYQPVGNYVLTNDSRLTDARPASDVYTWAKATTKPTYTYTEVGSAPTIHTHNQYSVTGHTHSEYQLLSTSINTSNIGSQSVAYAGNAGTLDNYDSNAFSFSGHTHSGVYQPIGSYQTQLNGTGLVKANGTTITYDNTTYQPLSTAINTSNISSQSVANANKLDNLDSSAFSLTGHTHTGVYQPVGSYVLTSDSRLSDARTPLAHSHAFTDLTAKSTTISGYGITDTIRNYGRTLTDANSGTFNFGIIGGNGGSTTNLPTASAYATLLSFPNLDTGLQLYGGWNSDNLYFRGWGNSGSVLYDWRKVWHSGNANTSAITWNTAALNINGEFNYFGKTIVSSTNDSWLRINPTNDFTSGIYFANSILKTDNNILIGAVISLTSSGTITASSTIQGTQLKSTIATGTAPLTVNSTTKVTNLNADLFDGYSSNAFSLSAHTHANYVEDTDTRLSNSRPASDVYTWAKSASKPSYSYSEVGAASANHTHPNYSLSGHTHTGVYQPVGSYQTQLNGTGLVKANGTTITYDNTTYQPASTAINTSNIASQSVNYASNAGMLDGYNSTAFASANHTHSNLGSIVDTTYASGSYSGSFTYTVPWSTYNAAKIVMNNGSLTLSVPSYTAGEFRIMLVAYPSSTLTFPANWYVSSDGSTSTQNGKPYFLSSGYYIITLKCFSSGTSADSFSGQRFAEIKGYTATL